MQTFVNAEGVRYGGERQIVLVFDKALDAFKQPLDRRQGRETHQKGFATGSMETSRASRFKSYILQTGIASKICKSLNEELSLIKDT